VIRMILLSFVACLSTLGGVYGAMALKTHTGNAEKSGEPVKLQAMKTPMVSVPVLEDGQVLGYVVTRLQFTADSTLVKASSIQPEAFVADEAFRYIYETTPKDIKLGQKLALRDFSARVVSGVNQRLGREVVKDVLVDSWSYLSKQDMMRNHGSGQ